MTTILTKQEIFDKVATHLATQGEQAVSRHGTCLYRSPGRGLKCAIGALIPDCRYQEWIEGKGALEILPLIYPEIEDRWFVPSQIGFLINLQELHDIKSNWVSSDTMKDALEVFASRYNLDSSIIDTLDWSKLPQ